MSPAVLVLFVTFASGSGAVATIDMPSMQACKAAANEIVAARERDTSARCISRVEK
jgi:hypothetical protein